jgi:hypothetical protein
MSTFLSQVVSDSQTTITCAFGGILGTLGNETSNYVIRKAGLSTMGTHLGETGMSFVISAIVGSAFYILGDTYLPETSSNIFYSILFFSSSSTLMSTGLAIAKLTAGGLTGAMARESPESTYQAPKYRMPPSSCGGSSCGGK